MGCFAALDKLVACLAERRSVLDGGYRSLWYNFYMSPVVKEILQHVASWPEEDQEELAEVAREIEARRTGVYVLSDAERAAIAEARKGPLASDEDVAAFWARHGIA